MLKDNNGGAQLTGNDRFEGFIPEMMDELSKMLDFTYHLYQVSLF